jgi:hypothetical protein
MTDSRRVFNHLVQHLSLAAAVASAEVARIAGQHQRELERAKRRGANRKAANLRTTQRKKSSSIVTR